MRIAEVSEQYGISSDTLRNYERVGLIAIVEQLNGKSADLM
jgi:DNA-binding transcriptional MerR regulator